MKKMYFIMICIVMLSTFTASGQSVVSGGSIDVDNNGNPEPLPLPKLFLPKRSSIRIPVMPQRQSLRR